MDLISELGGIGASISLAAGSIGFVFVINYAALVSGVIHRKSKEQHRLHQIQKMTEQLQKPNVVVKVHDLKLFKEFPNYPQETYEEQEQKLKCLESLMAEYCPN